MLEEPGVWKKNLINSVFLLSDSEQIQQIPLIKEYTADKLMWMHHKEGCYTVTQ
jgi:hypothetical protein